MSMVVAVLLWGWGGGGGGDVQAVSKHHQGTRLFLHSSLAGAMFRPMQPTVRESRNSGKQLRIDGVIVMCAGPSPMQGPSNRPIHWLQG